MAVLVFGSLAEDRQDPSLDGLGGRRGGVASFSIFLYDSGNFAPFLATALGGAAGLLLRSRVRTSELVGEAEELRGQAAWLEQRTVVARELHDVVGHHVTAMVVQAEAGQVADPQEALRTIGELGRTALAELDSLVVHLRDPGAPLTVSAPPRLLDIDELLAEPLRRSGVAVDVRLGDDLGLDELDVLTVYRIAQEALTNVARHARARHVWVELTRNGDHVRLRVSDDGAGPPAERTRGSGLVGIEERVSAPRWLGRAGRAAGRRHDPRREPAGVRAMTRVAVVDDQQLVRDGFSLILGAQPDLEVAVEAADGQAFLDAVRADPRIDVALVDIRMPVLDGLAATRALAAVPHAPAVIVVTTFDDDAYVLDAIAAGARGFLLKRCSAPSSSPRCGRSRAVTRSCPTEVTEAVLARVRSSGPATRADLTPYALTDRELEVLALVGAGLNNTEIAGRLHLSMSSVKTHVSNVLAKTHSRDRVQAAILAIRAGLRP